MKNIVIFSLVALLVASCSSGPKKGDFGETGENPMDLPLSAQSMGSDSGQIPGLSTVHFGYDQATLTPETRNILKQNADWIKGRGNIFMRIEGHCDENGSVEYNLALGERRAKAVQAYLVSLGVDSKRLTIVSFGEEKPLDPGNTPEAYSKNRRANFVPVTQ